MVLPIVKYGSTTLRKLSEEISKEDDIEAIYNQLFDTIKKEKGLGLAAPQIGILKRAFFIDTTPLFNGEEPEDEEFNVTEITEKLYINPQILWKDTKKNAYTEGCLSIPGIYEDVVRPSRIKISYLDKNLNLIEEDYDGIKARIFQHEYDHLEGILFVDKIRPLKRKLISKKLNKIKNS